MSLINKFENNNSFKTNGNESIVCFGIPIYLPYNIFVINVSTATASFRIFHIILYKVLSHIFNNGFAPSFIVSAM